MTSFKKMRLIPEFMYEKLHQSENKTVDFGDDSNSKIFDLTQDISSVLKDKSLPIEERVRMFYQHLLRKMSSKASEEMIKKKQNEGSKDDHQVDSQDKKKADEKEAETKIDSEDDDRNERSRALVIKQREKEILGTKVRQKKRKIVTHPHDSFFSAGRKKKPEQKPVLKKRETSAGVVTPTKESDKEADLPAVQPETEKFPQQMQNKDEDDYATASEGDDGDKAELTTDAVSIWKQEQKANLSTGNRLTAQRRFKQLLLEFFETDGKTGELFFRDDNKLLRGADLRKIINYFVPLKHIHPKGKPNGVAAVIEILRTRDLLDHTLFPNESVTTLFSEFGKKPTAYQEKIQAIEGLNKKIQSIASGLQLAGNGQADEAAETTAGSSSIKNWTTFT